MKFDTEKVRRHYDFMAGAYDLFTRSFYHRPRKELVKRLKVSPGMTVYLPAVGTGALLPYLNRVMRNTGLIVGTDVSEKMLARARARIRRHNWTNVRLIKVPAEKADAGFMKSRGLPHRFDLVAGELAFSVIPDWKRALQVSSELLAPGGRLGLLDWYCPHQNIWTRAVDFVAHSECGRPVPETARKLLKSFSVHKWYAGGRVYVGTGVK